MQPAQESRNPRDVAGYKRAVRRAIAAAVPPRNEMFIAAELSVDRPRATPMLLENDISHYAWRQNHRGNEKTTARPGINNLRHGKMSLITSAPTAGATSSAEIHTPRLRARINGG